MKNVITISNETFDKWISDSYVDKIIDELIQDRKKLKFHINREYAFNDFTLLKNDDTYLFKVEVNSYNNTFVKVYLNNIFYCSFSLFYKRDVEEFFIRMAGKGAYFIGVDSLGEVICNKKLSGKYDNEVEYRDVERIFTVFHTIQQKTLNSHKEIVNIFSDTHREIKERVTNYNNSKCTIKLCDGVVFNHIYENVRNYNRHTDSWGVRGHYRHYKSGKVIFIPPHKKGNGEIKDKNYII